MILSDFLLRQMHDNSDPHDIILISFNMHKTLYKNYYRIETKERYLVQTQSQTILSGIALPEVHGAKKTLDMNILPERQKVALQSKKIIENKPRLEQGRAGTRCKNPQPVYGITASTSKSQEIPKIPTAQNATKHSTDFLVQEQLITNKTEAFILKLAGILWNRTSG